MIWIAALLFLLQPVADGPQESLRGPADPESYPEWPGPTPGFNIRDYFPERAQRQGVSGRATIECMVTAVGTLSNCRVVDESPKKYGFGEAAIKISAQFRVRPTLVDGVPVASGPIRVPIIFGHPDGR